jgi:hypothetical protein
MNAFRALTRFCCGILTCALMLAVGLHSGAASAGTLFVTNNGVDSANCGAEAKPCRSISQALTNAASGSTIVVGPGRYGDIDGDGRFESPGDERPQRRDYSTPHGPPIALACVVCILKPVHLLSKDGAAATVIDAGATTYHVVQIAAQNVTFGDVDRGFMVTGGVVPGDGSDGGDGLNLAAGPAKIVGNIARANLGNGFDLVPGGEPPVAISHFGNGLDGSVLATDNLAVDNAGFGFRVVGGTSTNYVLMNNNVSTGNGGGVELFGSAPHIITHTLVSGNVAGISVDGGPFQFTHNVVVSNTRFGFSFFDKLEILRGQNSLILNDIIGNGSAGVTIGETSVPVVINRNNIYGNGVADGSNCGVAVFHNSADALNNYWGSAQGPGSDPADNVGELPLCNGTAVDAGVPATKPFATQAFGVL